MPDLQRSKIATLRKSQVVAFRNSLKHAAKRAEFDGGDEAMEYTRVVVLCHISEHRETAICLGVFRISLCRCFETTEETFEKPSTTIRTRFGSFEPRTRLRVLDVQC